MSCQSVNLTTWSRLTLKIKTISSVWIVCWTLGTLNLPPILWLLLVDLPQPTGIPVTHCLHNWGTMRQILLCFVFFSDEQCWLDDQSLTKDQQHILLSALWLGDGDVDRMIEVFVDLQCKPVKLKCNKWWQMHFFFCCVATKGEKSHISDLFVFNMLTISTVFTSYELKVLDIREVMIPFHVINFMKWKLDIEI